ncbi:MAG: hypothetical protein ACTSRG_17115 [Candidatus Helarchaeota archaeon]
MVEEQMKVEFTKWIYFASQIFFLIISTFSITFYLMILFILNYLMSWLLFWIIATPFIFILNKLAYKSDIKKIENKDYSKDRIKVGKIGCIFGEVILLLIIIYLYLFEINKGYGFQDGYLDIFAFFLTGRFIILPNFLGDYYLLIVFIIIMILLSIVLVKIHKLEINSREKAERLKNH